ncbi:MAG: hypothetical protein E7Z73_01980 [Methanobrevibacter millerae]|uniref:Uncharacterized protein n=1 Tax=Methanobrevibacter millerae TaxID=230361 RepID=A0A8T3VBH0_9EURY|nr:hypothetical protein [Methanobrevibacter millerae]MBE6504502.1 hypothetical protein [Methanobrevibacter millerae]
MDELEDLIGKSIDVIDKDITDALDSINIKAAILEYKYKNCGVRYPSTSLKLMDIDYNNVISFKDLFNFDRIFIFWHYKGTITDLEVFDISSDKNLLKKDYEVIVSKINNGEAHNIRAGDTKLLAAERLNDEIFLNGKKVNGRTFVLKKYYLQKILNELKLY